MPYKIKIEGIKEVSKMLGSLEESAAAIASKALYEGAGIVAEELNKGAAGIKTAPFKYASTSRGETRLPSPEEKEIIERAGAGIAKFKGGGTEINTSIGYSASGYANLAGRTVPIPLIVNSINSGTSFMKKQAFVRKAANSGGKQAVAKMKEVIQDEVDAIINNK